MRKLTIFLAVVTASLSLGAGAFAGHISSSGGHHVTPLSLSHGQ